MKPTKKLLTLLHAQQLVSAPDLPIGSMVELEREMLRQLSASRTPSVVWFDGECIEGPSDYQTLIGEFIAASGSAEDLADIRCVVDFEEQRAMCH